MASIVLGIGCSHTPQMHTPADQWDIRAKRDSEDGLPFWYHGERLMFAELLEKRRHLDLESQISLAEREARLQKACAALDQLSKLYRDIRPDVTLIFGNDQAEIFIDEPRHAFTIMGAEEFENRPRTDDQIKRLPPGIALADRGHLPDECVRLPGHPALARHIYDVLADSPSDVAYAPQQIRPDPGRASTSGMPHAYGFIYKQVMRDAVTPHVPVDTNTLYPPNQPTTQECFAFGQKVGEAIADWEPDARVCIIASGGLSHFVVDEEFDRDILAAMTTNEFERLFEYHEGYYQAGASEIKSWIAAGGAMTGNALKGRVVDYQALYRTPAGTGSSAAFAAWT